MAENLFASTSAVNKILAGALLGTSSVDLYTVPASTGCVVKKAVVCNVTATVTTLFLSVTKAGGSANPVFYGYPINGADTVDLTELQGLNLGAGDKISASANNGAALRLLLTGIENS